MSPLEENKAIVQRYVAAFNDADYTALREIFAADAEVQGVLGWGKIAWVITVWQELHAAFDMQLTVEEIIAENDRVAVRYVERGTFRSDFRGHPATGKSYELIAMEWFELRAGKIQRRWGARDSAAQARQIGLPLH